LRRDDGLWNELKAKKGLVGSVRQLKAFDCVDYQTHVNDLVSIVDGLRGRVIVAGHSYGAAVAIGASDVVSNKIEGMFLSSPFLELAWWKKLLGFKGFNGFPKADELVEMVQNYEGEVRVMYSRDDSINNPQKNAKRIIACKGEGSIARVNNSSQHDFFGSVREEYVALLGEFVSYVGREN
jgi:pimeloyl-ACP methyl ester carboxylesterase